MRLKIRKDVKMLDEELPRRNWPFGEMEVGDVLDFRDLDEWPSVSKYALTYARKKKPRWILKVTWIESLKIGRVRRLA